MRVTGVVVKTRRTRTPHGSSYMAVTLRRNATHDVTLRYLNHPSLYQPVKGDMVAVTGTAMAGYTRVNIGGVSVERIP
jgi:hypothetical protein